MNAKPVVIFLVACIGLTLLGGLAISAHVHQQQESQQDEKIKKTARKKFMRGKLMSNQKIVEGLSIKDYALVREGGEGVTALVKGQHWFVLDTQEYKEYSKDMEHAANKLIAAADNKNMEAATLRYFELTLTCIDCHRYLETMDK